MQSRRQNEDESKPSTIEERRTRMEMFWNDRPQKPVAMAALPQLSELSELPELS